MQSWCQVAAETMPTNSLIVGVDLAPIKPIPRTITFQSDITTDKCRATIRQHLKTWKADTVLHDGAPNVGTAWVQDAFSQAELALQAMKLATEFLVEGGTFVTKVFRSKDYNALLWVFNQLFTKVESTKPPSSRNVSAEIFVICRGFKAPKRIDPKFLDPRTVFAELTDPTPNNEAKVFNPEKKKRKRDGYEEGDYIQFKEAPASEFIQTTDPIAMLGTLNRLSFEQNKNGDVALAALSQLIETTPEIRQCCEDLKVLGRKEFRALLRWRLKARERFGLSNKKQVTEVVESEEVAEITPMDEELRIQEELQRLNDADTSRRKRDRRRENERKQREIVRMQMHMITPREIGLEQAGPNGEDSVFALKAVDRAGAIDRIARGRMVSTPLAHQEVEGQPEDSDEKTDEEEDRLDRELDTLYESYQERKSDADAKFRAKKARKEHADGSWDGFYEEEKEVSEDPVEENEGSSSEDDMDAPIRSLIHDPDYSGQDPSGLTKRASIFFDQDVFKELGDIEPADSDDSAIDLDADRDTSLAAKASAQDDRNINSLEKEPSIANSDNIQKTSYKTLESKKSVSKLIKVKGTEHPDKDSLDGFEVVKGGGGSEWEKQGELRPDGRLGNFSSLSLC